MGDLRYNYVILGYADDYYKIAYSKLSNVPEVYCCMKQIDSENKLLVNLFRIHCSGPLYSRIDLPFKGVWNKYIFRHEFENNNPICFVFFARNKNLNKSVIRYLKAKYPGCKIVVYWTDLFDETFIKNYSDIKDVIDVKICYDYQDSLEQKCFYFPTSYSRVNLPQENNNIEQSDIFYVGKEKGRLKTILQYYNMFEKLGLRCDFWIDGVKKEDLPLCKGIHVNTRLSYLDCLQHIQKTKAILEIMQERATGYTLRTKEALIYKKKLITNNKHVISDSSIYDKDYIYVVSDYESFDRRWIDTPVPNYPEYEQLLDPNNLVHYIDSIISVRS